MTILLFIDYFLPGTKHGGPVVTISNLIKKTGDKINFKIITRNRDERSKESYSNLKSNIWLDKDHYKIMYLDESHLNTKHYKSLIKETPHDFIYISSFFSPKFSFFVLLSCLLIKYKNKIVLSPKGEFSRGALNMKKIKKNIYIKLHNILFANLRIIFHASSEIEKGDIDGLISNKRDIKVARDIINLEKYTGEARKEGPLRIIFLSRIDPMKNLKFVLYVLKGIDIQIELSIYGGIYDENYWNECLSLMETMPANIDIDYLGHLDSHEVQKKFSENDLFLFPTLGENFGHVILESISSGTCVLLSNNTLWKSTENRSVYCHSIDSVEEWRNRVIYISRLDSSGYEEMRLNAHSEFSNYKNTFNKHAIIDNLNLFS